MDTTGKALVDHWSWAAEKGVMNKNTAGGMRAACAQVLSALDDWETVDIKALDVEGTLLRFQNLKAKEFKPAVLDTYKRRFRQGVASYLKYLEDPGDWRPRTVERPTTSSGKSQRDEGTGPEAAPRPPVRHDMAQAGFVDYPFPLREGQNARLVLPRDLKMAEVKRLSAFMSTLVVDFEPGVA